VGCVLAPGEFLCMPARHDPRQNHLLAALSPAERERVIRALSSSRCLSGRLLYESGDVLSHVYFPTDSIVSLLYILENGASAEISVARSDGLIGVALFMGVRPLRAGRSCRVRATRTGWPARTQERVPSQRQNAVLLLRYIQR